MTGILDVRGILAGDRYAMILARHATLRAGEAFELRIDHERRPLTYQLEADHAGAFTWLYLEEGPTAWRVRIGRP